MAAKIVLFIAGVLVVGIVCFDVFQAVIVPRMTSPRFRIAPFMVRRVWWSTYRKFCSNFQEELQNTLLHFFAPASFIGMFILWFTLLIAGVALLLLALGQYVDPPINDLAEAIYSAGSSVLTLGIGDVTAPHWSTRLIVLLAAMLGIVFLGLQVSYLFALQTYLQQREEVVNTLNSRAGSPASGLVLLLRYRELNIVPSLSSSFVSWESWVATIFESHRVYPLLLYFRSSSATNSWISSIGALCDAAALISTSLQVDGIGEASLFYWLAIKTLKGLSSYVGLKPQDGVYMTKEDFTDGLALLKDSGYTLKNTDQAWERFSEMRAGYMRYLVPFSETFLIPLQIWTVKLVF